MGKGSVNGRPKVLKPEIRNLIITWATETHRLMDREALAEALIDEIERLGEDPPTIKTLIAMISTARSSEKERIDEPWSMSVLRDQGFSLAPDVIPYVVQVQQRQKNIPPLSEVSIRQAQWIARLCKIIPNIDDLAIISWYYTLYDRVSRKANTPFDTTKPDSVLPDKDKVIEAFSRLIRGSIIQSAKTHF